VQQGAGFRNFCDHLGAYLRRRMELCV